jgi:hypothetical protein
MRLIESQDRKRGMVLGAGHRGCPIFVGSAPISVGQLTNFGCGGHSEAQIRMGRPVGHGPGALKVCIYPAISRLGTALIARASKRLLSVATHCVPVAGSSAGGVVSSPRGCLPVGGVAKADGCGRYSAGPLLVYVVLQYRSGHRSRSPWRTLWVVNPTRSKAWQIRPLAN